MGLNGRSGINVPISLEFISFDADSLEIIDGSSKKLRSGNILPSNIDSNGDSLILQFAPGAQISNKGFEIRYLGPGKISLSMKITFVYCEIYFSLK